MPFKSFHWLSHDRLWAIISRLCIGEYWYYYFFYASYEFVQTEKKMHNQYFSNTELILHVAQ